MTTITPTVGRVLHFIPTADYMASRKLAFGDPSQPLAAVIAYVHSDTMVNLTVWDQNGLQFGVCSVPLVQVEGLTIPCGSFYAQWMPYQKGQAAKTEELQFKYDARCAVDKALTAHHAGRLGQVAPRITLDDIEASIAAEHYFTAGQALAALNHPVSDGLDLLTVCVILLRNGTKIVGINYGAIDPAQHSEERGRKEARDHAIEQIWPLLGYELRSRLHQRALYEAEPKVGYGNAQGPAQAGE